MKAIDEMISQTKNKTNSILRKEHRDKQIRIKTISINIKQYLRVSKND